MGILAKLFRRRPKKPTILDIQWEAADILKECARIRKERTLGKLSDDEMEVLLTELDLRNQNLDNMLREAGLPPSL